MHLEGRAGGGPSYCPHPVAALQPIPSSAHSHAHALTRIHAHHTHTRTHELRHTRNKLTHMHTTCVARRWTMQQQRAHLEPTLLLPRKRICPQRQPLPCLPDATAHVSPFPNSKLLWRGVALGAQVAGLDTGLQELCPPWLACRPG